MSEKKSEFLFIRNRTSTWINTPSQSFDLLPGVNLLRASAWQALLDAKELLNGLPSHCAKLLRDRIADGTLKIEPADPEFAASLGKIDRQAATSMIAETFRPSLLGRWWAAEKRAAVREAIGQRLCELLGYVYKPETASTLAQLGVRERDEFTMGTGSGQRQRALYERAGLREWQPAPAAPRDAFGAGVI